VKPLAPEGVPRIDVSCEELEALLEGARVVLGEAGYQKLQAAIRTLGYVTELLQNQAATLASLRRLLCHSITEKTSKVLKQAGIETGEKRDKTPDAPHTPKSTASGNRRKCFVSASTPAFLPTISRHFRCRAAPCGSMSPDAGRIRFPD
jgi:hypothetical protein